MVYANGRVPLNLLVHLGARHYLAPGVAVAWAYLVRLAQAKYGVTLYITPQLTTWDGWNGYRPLDAQIIYRAYLGAQAAEAGKSPHGWLRAIDVWNWRDLAPGNEALAWARFVALCKIALFATLRVPNERWHIEFTGDPWTAPTYSGVVVNPATTNRPPAAEEEIDMFYIYWTSTAGKSMNAVYNGDGFWDEWESDDGTYNTAQARMYKVTETFAVSPSHADARRTACAKKRAGIV